MAITTDRRLLLVHAHPDDESINNGATMARYIAEGVRITLVTCTRGELGEVIPADLAQVVSGRPDRLGEHRVGELAAAMAALGVRDHRFLDEVIGDPEYPLTPVHYRDSGMAWGSDGQAVAAPDTRPGSFALTDLDDAAGRLAIIIREVRPQVLITYEPGGGYGHPDHVHAHRVTMRAVELAGGPGPGGEPWAVVKVYWVVLPERAFPDELVTTVVDGTAFFDAKSAAMRVHASQIAVDGPFFALSNGVRQPILALEFYRLASGIPGGPKDDDGRETDLFAGLFA